tara:strand:- start:441 stop:1586 length:1146 start_codon:yes stop_codon:yes gene_type:complete
MGFFSKVFKTIKKNFKRVGKWIKKGIMKVGKFMNKIGIVGQIALGLILPGIGSALGAWAGTTLAVGSTAGTIAKAAATFVNAAINVGSKVSSVFSTVTKGVGKVIGDTVGAVLNKIPGASDLIQNVTGKLGMKGGVGIDISQKTFTGAFDTATKVLTDTVAAGKDLFSMSTITDKNKYYLEAMKSKVAEAIPTSGNFSKAGIDTFDSTKPQMSGLTDGDTTNLFPSGTSVVDPKVDLVKVEVPETSSLLADPTKKGFVDTVKTKITEGKEYLGEKVGSIIPDAIDQTAQTLTDLPSNLIKKKAGLIGPAEQGNVYRSTVVMEAPQPMQFETTDLIGGMPQGQNMLQGLAGNWGRGAWLYNAEQETQAFKQKQQQFANAGGM